MNKITTKFTLGPWKATKSQNFAGTFVSYITPNKNECIAQTRSKTREVDEANAQLIASAPELFEALVALINEYGANNIISVPLPDCWINALKAVSKAKGE